MCIFLLGNLGYAARNQWQNCHSLTQQRFIVHSINPLRVIEMAGDLALLGTQAGGACHCFRGKETSGSS